MNTIVLVLLAVVLVIAVFLTLRRFRKGGGCCGSHAQAEKRQRSTISARECTREMVWSIGGMTCGNCARRVQNALNAVPGVSAKVSIDTKKACIRCTETVTEEQLRAAVTGAGYVVLNNR